MAVPRLVPCLVALRAEFNQLNPLRDRSSDGWIGDRAHQDRPSDHNDDEDGETPYEDADSDHEVHALDVDASGPWPGGIDMSHLTEEVVRRHREGLDDRLQNVIYAGRIASRSWGWTWRQYTGANGHHEHGHFSARYTSVHEASTRPWGLVARFAPREDLDMMSTEDMRKLAGLIGDATAASLLATKVTVGNEAWTVGACIGYVARKAYEIDKTLDNLAPATEPATPPATAAAGAAPAKKATGAATR